MVLAPFGATIPARGSANGENFVDPVLDSPAS
jgi:hypothetical protein